MSSEDATTTAGDAEPATVTFKVKSSSEGNHTITMAETASVLDLKNKLAGDDYEKIPADRQRLIYSGRVMKNEEPLSTYKIKPGNTVHMVKSAASNVAQTPSSSGASVPGSSGAAPGVPTNMAAGTANNPLAGLTGARFAGHMGLPDAGLFGADGGMGAPPSEDAMASMLEDPNMQQTLNEALNNPDMINMMINSTPLLRNNPHAREMLQSPEFRRMMTNPEALRQAAQMRRMMGGDGVGGNSFPAPGVTDTTPAGAAGSTGTTGNQQQRNPPAFNPMLFGGANPFGAMFGGMPGGGAGADGNAGSTNAAAGENANRDPNNAAQNPFAALFGGAGGAGAEATPFGMQGMPPITPEMMQHAMQALGGAGAGGLGGLGGGNIWGGEQASAQPADSRPPEERYAEQLRQLNDMGFFDFDRNVEALRRSGGSVQGAIEQLLT